MISVSLVLGMNTKVSVGKYLDSCSSVILVERDAVSVVALDLDLADEWDIEGEDLLLVQS